MTPQHGDITPPDLDALCGPDLVPLAWHEWTSEERGKYANLIAFSTGPDWEPPVVPCSGCGEDRPDWRWMLARHRAGGWWHTATCMPPDDWTGPEPTCRGYGDNLTTEQ